MKAWVLKARNKRYVDDLKEALGPLNMATLWPRKWSAQIGGGDWIEQKEDENVKPVEVEIKEV